MTIDKDKVEQALRDFVDLLPERPAWVVIVRQNGEFVSRTGEFFPDAFPVDDITVAQATHSAGLREQDTLDSLNHENLKYSILVGGTGVYIILNMNDAYWLGISYRRGVINLENIIYNGILEYYRRVLNTLYL